MKPHDEGPRKFEEFADLRREWGLDNHRTSRKLGSESCQIQSRLPVDNFLHTCYNKNGGFDRKIKAAEKTLRLLQLKENYYGFIWSFQKGTYATG